MKYIFVKLYMKKYLTEALDTDYLQTKMYCWKSSNRLANVHNIIPDRQQK